MSHTQVLHHVSGAFDARAAIPAEKFLPAMQYERYSQDQPDHEQRQIKSRHCCLAFLLCREAYETLTTVFPKFAPEKMPANAAGKLSKPSATCSLNFMLPALSHAASRSCISTSSGS